MKETIMYVNSVPRQSAQGWHKANYVIYNKTTQTVARTIKGNTSKAFGRDGHSAETFMFPINHATNQVIAGLNKLVRNRFQGLTVDLIRKTYKCSDEWTDDMLKELSKKEFISLQSDLELRYGTTPDYLTSKVTMTIFSDNINSTLKSNARPNFLERFKYTFVDGANRLSNSQGLKQALAQQLALVHPAIAQTKQDINNVVHRFYISEANEAEQERFRKQETVNNAIADFVTLQKKISDFQLYQFASLLTLQNNIPIVTGNRISTLAIKDRIDRYLKDSHKYQLNNINKFNNLYKLFTNKKTHDQFQVMYLVQQAINTGIISLIDGYYTWHEKSNIPNLYKLSTSKDAVINLFLTGYSSTEETGTNWCKDLQESLKLKGVKLTD